MSFEQDSYTVEEGTTVTNIRLLATDFPKPFQVQIFVFTLDADVTEKEVEAEISELNIAIACCVWQQSFTDSMYPYHTCIICNAAMFYIIFNNIIKYALYYVLY